MSPYCPFCDHTNLSIRTITEGTLTRVIISDPALMKGHLLVAPKRHIEQPWELHAPELQELFENIFTYQKILSEEYSAGCDIRQHYRPFMQQSRLKVDHVHFHLLPRAFKDELYQKSMVHETTMFRNLNESEIAEIKNTFISTHRI